ncbi:thioredoxin fold domain-containing protein [Aureimonas pseudogalii]|uniref:Thiol:disulfide interchange protein DsbG n=1 Tax=Aureimonas pseudogalii TaxID=1744844 RepID=A0A7W6H7R9_9HYPH|nr:thioredoxin fold domain-containing protein [Aureimonas pseudogalii]MBB4000102.1 thiol:disulfide interchange protein DsbG [Aureimonas pseudogalii]
MTTTEGFTVIGDVIGPGGQDLSSALLAISGLAASAAPNLPPLQSSVAPPTTSQQAALSLPQAALSPVPVVPPVVLEAAPVAPATSPVAQAAPTSAGATPPPLTMARAQTFDELFQQATDFSVWFSAGTPKPGAPAIYFVADPTCPHCAVAVDTLAQKVQAGDIDLRVILAPIRSQQAVYEAASMLQSKTPAADFMSHELSKTTSTPSSLKVLAPTDISPEIVRGLQRNVEWIRANGVQGVPFWIYTTAEGGKVEFGEVKDAMLKSAHPARGTAQVAAQASQQ